MERMAEIWLKIYTIFDNFESGAGKPSSPRAKILSPPLFETKHFTTANNSQNIYVGALSRISILYHNAYEKRFYFNAKPHFYIFKKMKNRSPSAFIMY